MGLIFNLKSAHKKTGKDNCFYPGPFLCAAVKSRAIKS